MGVESTAYEFSNLPEGQTDLKADEEYFFSMLPRWLMTNLGQWVVIRNQQERFAPSQSEAVKISVEGVNPETAQALIKQIHTGHSQQKRLFDTDN